MATRTRDTLYVCVVLGLVFMVSVLACRDTGARTPYSPVKEFWSLIDVGCTGVISDEQEAKARRLMDLNESVRASVVKTYEALDHDHKREVLFHIRALAPRRQFDELAPIVESAFNSADLVALGVTCARYYEITNRRARLRGKIDARRRSQCYVLYPLIDVFASLYGIDELAEVIQNELTVEISPHHRATIATLAIVHSDGALRPRALSALHGLIDEGYLDRYPSAILYMFDSLVKANRPGDAKLLAYAKRCGRHEDRDARESAAKYLAAFEESNAMRDNDDADELP